MAGFWSAVGLAFVCVYANMTGKSLSRPFGTQPEDRAVGVDLLVAAGAFQLGLILRGLGSTPAEDSSWTITRVYYLIGLGVIGWSYAYFMKQCGYTALSQQCPYSPLPIQPCAHSPAWQIKISAARSSTAVGAFALLASYLLNTNIPQVIRGAHSIYEYAGGFFPG